MIRLLAALVVLTGSLMSVHAAIPAGSLDPEFGIEGRRMFLDLTTGSSFIKPTCQALQPDGKLLVAGQTSNGRGYTCVALARFLPNGELDAGFGTAGMVVTDMSAPSTAHGMGLISDGKILVMASTDHDGYALIRYNTDGSVDSTYGTNGIFLKSIRHGISAWLGLVVYPNGKAVVAIKVNQFLSLYAHQPTGNSDPDFKTQPGDLRFNNVNVMESAQALLLQPDGKIVIAGLSEDDSAPPLPIKNFGLLRLNPNGSLDTTFNQTGKVTTTFGTLNITSFKGIAIAPGGKIVLTGAAGSSVAMARYLPNGILDISLGGNGKLISTPGAQGGFSAEATGIAIQSDGKMVLSGVAGKPNTVGPTKSCLMRFQVDGTLDGTFPGNGFWISEESLSGFFMEDIRCDAQDRILLGGFQSFDNTNQMTVYRLTAEGGLDSSFNTDGYAHVAFQSGLYSRKFNAVAEQPDGKILVAGDGLSRLLADGTLDTAFGTNGHSTTLHIAEEMLLQPDGKIVLAATLRSPGDIVISRYLADGSPDASFGTDGEVILDASSHDVLNKLLIQPDGKIIVAGSSGHHFVTIRLLADGTPDPTFGENGVQATAYFPNATDALGAALQADGKILLSGSTVDGEIDKACLLRLNADGSLDTTFNGTGKVLTAFGAAGSAAIGVALQPDGKVLATGYAAVDSGGIGDGDLAVARYLSDGSLDASFNGTGILIQALDPHFDEGRHILLQADGKIILTGQRTEERYASHDDIAIVRLTSDGQLDKTFRGSGVHLINVFDYPSNGTASDDIPRQPILQRDEKILLPFSSITTRSFSSYTDYGLVRILTEARVPKMEVVSDNVSLADGAATLDFGSAHNRTANRRTLQILNLGEEELRLSQFTFSGTHNGDFRAGSGLTVIAPGASKEIHLDFSPKGLGTRTAEVALVSNDPLAPSFRIALTGSAAPLEFATQPQPQLALAGSTVTLSAPLVGEPPVTFEWRKNGKAIRNTDQPRLTLSPVKPSDAGLYFAQAANDFSDIRSSDAFLGVLTPAPAAITLVQGRTLVLNARVAAPAGASISYVWQRGDEELSDGERISGSREKTLKISGITVEESKSYTCQITLTVNDQSATLPHGETEVTVLQPPSLAALTFVDKYVGEPVSYSVEASNIPSLFTASGLPPGVVINKQTGLISGSPTTARVVRGENVPYKVTITASNAAGKESKSADWLILPLPIKMAGSYHGLITRDNALNLGLGGIFKLNVQPSSAFSGQLSLGALKYSFKGKLEVTSDGTSAESVITIRRRSPLPDLKLTFTLQPDTGELSGEAMVSGDSENSVEINALRSPWSRVEKPEAYLGVYNSALQPHLPDNAEASTYPEGEGYAMLKIAPTGVATWSGRLADGSTITGSTHLLHGGRVPLHTLFYKNSASVQGWSTVSAPAKNLDGTLDWVKLNLESPGKERAYRHGFPLHTLNLVGGVYTPPPDGDLLPGLSTAPSNIQIAFICRSAMAPHSQSFTMTETGKLAIPANDAKLNLRLNVKTGIYTGGFSLNDPDPNSQLAVKPNLTRAATFTGALIPRLGRGSGYCLVPLLPTKPNEKTTQTPVLSGTAVLTTSGNPQ